MICTGGDHRLGGALWDEAVVLDLAESFRTQTGEASDPMDDPEVLNDLFLQAERGKKTSPSATRPPSASPTPANRPGSSSSVPGSRRSPATSSTGRSS